MKKEEIIDNITTVLDLINTNIREEAKRQEIEINPSQVCILKLLMANNGVMKVADIVSYKKKRKTTITEILKGLEDKGYISKCQCDIDRREVYISATQKLQDEYPLIKEFSNTVLENIYKNFSEGERILLTELLEKIEFNLKK